MVSTRKNVLFPFILFCFVHLALAVLTGNLLCYLYALFQLINIYRVYSIPHYSNKNALHIYTVQYYICIHCFLKCMSYFSKTTFFHIKHFINVFRATVLFCDILIFSDSCIVCLKYLFFFYATLNSVVLKIVYRI